MRGNTLFLVTSPKEAMDVSSPYSNTTTESLWDTAKNSELHILLREPALLELARRGEPGVQSFCEVLIGCGDQECWFTGIHALASLRTYDAVSRLLVTSGSLNPCDRNIVIHTVATVLSSAHRETFRRVLHPLVVPGFMDVTGWTPTAVRILKSVCEERGLVIIASAKDIPLWVQTGTGESESLETTTAQSPPKK
jgi:hypothetical protein